MTKTRDAKGNYPNQQAWTQPRGSESANDGVSEEALPPLDVNEGDIAGAEMRVEAEQWQPWHRVPAVQLYSLVECRERQMRHELAERDKYKALAGELVECLLVRVHPETEYMGWRTDEEKAIRRAQQEGFL